jgi:hypothetical protein
MKKSDFNQGQSASELISKRIAELGDWRGKTLGTMRKLIPGRRPRRRRGVEVDRHSGVVARWHHLHRRILQECREAYFAKGASLKDPSRLFNSSLEGSARRAIDIHKGEKVDESAFKALVRQAIASTVLPSRNLRRNRSPEGFRP